MRFPSLPPSAGANRIRFEGTRGFRDLSPPTHKATGDAPGTKGNHALGGREVKGHISKIRWP